MRHILIKVILTMLATLALAGASAFDADAQTRPRKKQTQSRQQKTNTVKTPPKSQGETRSIDEIRRKKSAAEQKISETAGQLDRTGRELNRQLNRLNSLNADITNSQIVVDSLRTRLASIGSEINLTADSIHRYEEHLDDMRRAYIDAMRRLQPYGERTSALAFIFSSSSFTDAYRRIRYVRQFAAWRQAKADAITAAIDEIALRRSRLTSLRHEQDVAYRKAEASQRTLASQQAESEKMVKDLRKNEAQLRKNLDLHRRQAAALDNELGRLIQAEQDRMARQQREEEKRTASQPKPANNTSKPSAPEKPGASPTNIASNSQASISALTGSFASNKGRLPFPVEGTYKIVRRFGRQPHPTLPNVETENSGIDIETRPGANVRAVFAGTVSAIFRQDGFNSIVMLRHGNYITVYAGLGSVSVKSGQNVTAGQTLGTVYTPSGDSPLLHFEIRREREKLNPQAWVR